MSKKTIYILTGAAVALITLLIVLSKTGAIGNKDEGKEVETITRLSRVGFDNTLGFLLGGIEAWKAAGYETDSIESISPEVFAAQYKTALVIDSRKPGEFTAEHVVNAKNIPLDYVNEQLAEVPKDEKFFIHCAGGYRSMIAASILEARGFRNFSEVAGGYNAIAKTTVPKTNFVCQSKVLK